MIRLAIDELRVLPNDPATVDAYNIYLSMFVLKQLISANNNYGMITLLVSHFLTVGSIALITVCLFKINLQVAAVVLVWAISSFGIMFGVTYLKTRDSTEDEQMLEKIERSFLDNFDARKRALERGANRLPHHQPHQPHQEELP
jgi:hypothetical protein